MRLSDKKDIINSGPLLESIQEFVNSFSPLNQVVATIYSLVKSSQRDSERECFHFICAMFCLIISLAGYFSGILNALNHYLIVKA